MKMVLFAVVSLLSVALSAQESTAIRCDFTSQPEGAGVVVDGNMRGVTPITLYDIAPGRHHVRFEMQNYESVDDFVNLTPGGLVQKNAVLSPVKGLLLLTSDPAGCDISIDGYSLGQTPRLIASFDAKDVYKLSLQKPGYQPRSVDVRFDGRRPLVRHETLIIDSGVIDVTSDPAGADVVVNGQPHGTTPVTVRNVPKGRATVTLRMQGFDEETRELSVVAGESQTLFVKMSGQPGTISLSAVPDDARFYVTDQPEGRGPVILKNLKPGKYAVRVEREGFATVRKDFHLLNGGSIVEEFRLANVMGRLEVRTIPGGAQVLLDGAVVGVTKTRGEDTDPSEVLVVENVREGEHNVVIKREGYADVSKHPVIENQKTQSLNIRMKRIFTPNVEVETGNGVYRGMLISNTPLGVEVEVSLGIIRTFQQSEIRRLSFLD